MQSEFHKLKEELGSRLADVENELAEKKVELHTLMEEKTGLLLEVS